ncbi:MAG: HAD-IIIA family hydrolase [Candidatus Liptonbacteria bacterium]|nr:HAD-IIIA family hydrolase [Parcubacteria group bacterium]MBI4087348.1 HAD-IIIA family hydrolase [Candidatus Liptonbacteria bacterium]
MISDTRIKQAVILAGGPGLRLRPLTNDRPKPMVLVNDKPFLDYLAELLKKNGITEVVFLLGYLHEKITDYVGDGSRYGIKARYSISDVTDGTGTRIRKANEKGLLNEEFLLLYCDNYLNLQLDELYNFHVARGVAATVTVYSNKHGLTKNNIFVDSKGYVTKYDKSRADENMNGVDMGFFIINREKILELMPKEENFFFELVVMPALIKKGQLAGFVTDRFYYSIGSPARLQVTEQFLKPKKVVFLDRDGVINKRPPKGDWVKKWEEFEFLPGAVEAVKLLTEAGYEIYMISNQAGIARGAMTEDALHDINSRMEAEFNRGGGKLQGIYYCPHGWDSPCECRKPKPGMFFRAALDHYIDLPSAIFIGDDERDKVAGDAAGVKTILMPSDGNLLEVVKSKILDSRY